MFLFCPIVGYCVWCQTFHDPLRGFEMDDKEFSALVDRYVALRPVVNEQKSLAKKIRDELQERGIVSYITPAKNVAELVKKPTGTWLLDGLKKALPRRVFELLCPRKPDAKKLDQRLAAMVTETERRELAQCRQPGFKLELQVTAAGGVAEADDED